MFKFMSFLMLLLLANLPSSYAKIWRLNNNAGITADFTNLTDANNGAASGDTLHLEGSPTSYGSFNCTKKLTIIGTGYFLSENPNTQALIQTAKVGYINFYTGSSGSFVMGLEFLDNIYLYANDITIKRNKFATAYNTNPEYSLQYILVRYQQQNNNLPVNNIIISQNYGVGISVEYASSGIFIMNNYITVSSQYNDQTTYECLALNANSQVVVQNNIFRRGKVTASLNSAFYNNIMYAGTFVGAGTLVANNIASGTQFGTDNGNKANVSMSTVFVGTGTGISSDGQWKLKAGSPAIGAGNGSTAQNQIDDGIYSGPSPYVLSGMPPVPAIYYFQNQTVGSNTNPINVTIKVRSVNN